jgi:hypothetical protein
MDATVVAKHSSFVLSSVCPLAGFVVTVSISAIFQADVECSWIVVIPVSSDIPTLEVPTSRHCHSHPIFSLPPPIPHTLE